MLSVRVLIMANLATMSFILRCAWKSSSAALRTAAAVTLLSDLYCCGLTLVLPRLTRWLSGRLATALFVVTMHHFSQENLDLGMSEKPSWWDVQIFIIHAFSRVRLQS